MNQLLVFSPQWQVQTSQQQLYILWWWRGFQLCYKNNRYHPDAFHTCSKKKKTQTRTHSRWISEKRVFSEIAYFTQHDYKHEASWIYTTSRMKLDLTGNWFILSFLKNLEKRHGVMPQSWPLCFQKVKYDQHSKDFSLLWGQSVLHKGHIMLRKVNLKAQRQDAAFLRSKLGTKSECRLCWEGKRVCDDDP